jgi:hypothetical protein
MTERPTTVDEARPRVLDAVEGGRLPAGGPSHLVALGREADADYWARWSEAAAARIRAQPVRCTCALPGQPAADGRCSRCWGWPT